MISFKYLEHVHGNNYKKNCEFVMEGTSSLDSFETNKDR